MAVTKRQKKQPGGAGGSNGSKRGGGRQGRQALSSSNIPIIALVLLALAAARSLLWYRSSSSKAAAHKHKAAASDTTRPPPPPDAAAAAIPQGLTWTGADCPAPAGCRFNVTCDHEHYTPHTPGCHPPRGVEGACARFAMAGLATAQEVRLLIDMAERGMAGRRSDGGPTILDINGGFLRDPDGVVSVYKGREGLYSVEEYRFYADIVERIRSFVQARFELDFLHFTAPTFITRLVGSPEWRPRSMHDEYYQMHIDKESTNHYDYSGLLYLSEAGVDFEGGLFRMEDPAMTVLPTPGVVLSFSAGWENRHQVELVTAGTRYCLSFWFTCDATRRFKTFLDGKAHNRFEGAPADGAAAAQQ